MSVIPFRTTKRNSSSLDESDFGSPENLFRDSDVSLEQKMEILVPKFLSLVKYVAGRLAFRLPAHISMDDLIGSGTIGLVDSIQKFDPVKNVEFKTYAEFRIKGAILDELRTLDWIPRSVRKKQHALEKVHMKLQKDLGRPAEPEEVAQAFGVSMEKLSKLLDDTKSVPLVNIDDFYEDPHQNNKCEGDDGSIHEIVNNREGEDALHALCIFQLEKAFARSIEKLPFESKFVLCLYYYEEVAAKDIGRIVGYTESRVSQLLAEALCRLKPLLAKELGIENSDSEINANRYFDTGKNKRTSKWPKTLRYTPVKLDGTHYVKRKGKGWRVKSIYIPDFMLIGEPYEPQLYQPAKKNLPDKEKPLREIAKKVDTRSLLEKISLLRRKQEGEMRKDRIPSITTFLAYSTVIKLRGIELTSTKDLLDLTSDQFKRKCSKLDRRTLSAVAKKMIAKELYFQDGEEATRNLISDNGKRAEPPKKDSSPEISPGTTSFEAAVERISSAIGPLIAEKGNMEEITVREKFKADNGREYLLTVNITPPN